MDEHRFTALIRSLTRSRRAVVGSALGLGALTWPGWLDARKKRKKRECAKAGQKTSKQRKKCCKGLAKDATKRCAPQRCVCPANQICLRSGVCQLCDVACPSGNSIICGASLQAAMNLGGTVHVCPGVYRGGFTLNNLNNAVTVIGAGGDADATSNTILDGNGSGRVLQITNGEEPVELERLRITGGSAGSGGGIFLQDATLRLTDCTVNGNTVTGGSGGGIHALSDTTLEMTRCSVRDNEALGASSYGGGIIANGNTTLTDCLVQANSAEFGGGIVTSGPAILTGSTQVRGNAATQGGGIYVAASTLVIAESCRVTENTAAAPGNGGGIYSAQAVGVTLAGADPSPIVVDNCHENCVVNVPKCSPAPPASCPPENGSRRADRT